MTITAEVQLDQQPETDEVEPVEATTEPSEVQVLAALLAQAYVAMPLFA